MCMIEEFSSIKELYERLIPAMTTRVRELHREGYVFVKNEDVWNYLKISKWSKANGLELSDMVSDILSCSGYEMDDYLKKTFMNSKREINLDE